MTLKARKHRCQKSLCLETGFGSFEGFEADAAQDDLAAGYNRTKLAWYTVDPVFYTQQFRQWN